MTEVSVILSTYNSGETLSRAIDSVLGQVLQDIELMAVDDRSNISRQRILEDYAQRDRRVRIIAQSNHCSVAARNIGAAEASGKYITFMESNSAYAVNHLSFHCNFLEKHSEYPACMFADIQPISIYDPKLPFVGGGLYDLCYGSTFANNQLLEHFSPCYFMTRDSFKNIGGYRTEQTLNADLDLILRYIENFKCARIHGAGGCFYTDQENNTRKDLDDFIKCHVACYLSAWCRLRNIGDPVAEGKPLEEIISMAKSLPIKDRVVIYSSIRYFIEPLSYIHTISKREAKYYLLSILSDYKLMQKLIDIKFKDLRKEHRGQLS